MKNLRYERRGECVRCGWCCEYRVCSEYLSYDENGLAVCSIYGEHPGECQRFPQAPPILNPKCGYYFLDTWEENKMVKFGADL
jgi:hypothetical protein